jgi:hypothetical protein
MRRRKFMSFSAARSCGRVQDIRKLRAIFLWAICGTRAARRKSSRTMERFIDGFAQLGYVEARTRDADIVPGPPFDPNVATC